MPSIIMSKGIRPFFIETLERIESTKGLSEGDKQMVSRIRKMLQRAKYRKPKNSS